MEADETGLRGRLSTRAGQQSHHSAGASKLNRSVSRAASQATGQGHIGTASRTREWQEDAEVATLNPGRTHVWLADLSKLPKNFAQQILGLNPFKTSYFSLYRPLKDWKSRVVLGAAICFAIAAGVPLPIIGVIFAEIIDSFPPPEDELTKSLVQLVGVACAYLVITWIWSSCWGIVGEKVSKGLREALLEKLVGMDLAYYDVYTPDVSNVLTGETQTIQIGTSEKVGLFIQAMSYFVAAFIVGFILNAQLTGILFAAVIPTTFIVVCFGTTAASRLAKRANTVSEKASSVAEGAINAIQIVQAFGSQAVLTKQHDSFLKRAARTGLRKGAVGSVMLGTVYFVAYAANALAFYRGSRLVEETGAGTIYAVVFLILDASFVIGQFGPFIQSLALAASAGGRVLEIIDKPQPVIDVRSNEGMVIDHVFAKEADIDLDDLAFVYPARPTARVLDGVHLHFKAGTSTAIVGLSGSGKSTLASILLRLYDPPHGRVLFGGQDIKDLELTSYRSSLALVDQDPVLFAGTVLDNISRGIVDLSNYTEAEILEKCVSAASEAHCDFISNLPQGMLTELSGAGSTQLSGGQKQRICLARALVRDPSVLVLDEPTSALDVTSEALILQTLQSTAERGCTIIMIAHRLSTISFCSNVVLMHHGTIVEQGPPDELAQAGGDFSRLVASQQMIRHGSVPGLESPSDNEKTLDEKHVAMKERLHEATSGSDDNLTEPSRKTARLSAATVVRRCLRLSRPERPFILLGLVASVTSGALVLGEAVIFGSLVDLLNTQADSADFLDQIDFYCLLFFVVALIALLAYSTSGAAFGYVSEQLIMRAKAISLTTVLQQDLAWFSLPAHSTQSLTATINSDAARLAGLSGIIIGTVLSVFTSIVGGIVLAHAFAWKIAIVLLAAVPIMVFSGFLRLRILSKFEQRQETVYSDAAAVATEACINIRTVAAFGQENNVCARYKAALDKPYRQSFRFILGGNVILAFSLAITYFVYTLAYWWGARQVREGNYNQRQFFTVLPALLFSAQAAGQMFSLAPEVARARSAAASVFALHDEEPTISTSHHEQAPEKSLSSSRDTSAGTASSEDPAPHLRLHNVSLVYSDRDDALALDQVSLSIARGEFIGLVGSSGAGKSSIISLLERFYDPTSGFIEIDGVDISSLAVEPYRARLALVPQEPSLFPGSVHFNISLGARTGQVVTQAQIEEVCQRLNIHTFISSLPEGYETECGSNGSHLSGGQKQRIAIARALIRDPEILILDEATSALDGHSERDVQDAIAAARARGTTVIVVAHRLSTVAEADRIVVMEQGRIAEQGPHQQLIDQGGMYSKLVAQAQG